MLPPLEFGPSSDHVSAGVAKSSQVNLMTSVSVRVSRSSPVLVLVARVGDARADVDGPALPGDAPSVLNARHAAQQRVASLPDLPHAHPLRGRKRYQTPH